MYEGESSISISTNVKQSEDERLSLMREFIALTDSLDAAHESVREYEFKSKQLSETLAKVRRQLLGVVDPDSVPQEADPSPFYGDAR